MAARTPPAPGTVGAKLFGLGVHANTLVYRVSGGRIGSKFGNSPLLLLDHVGAKSGTKRTTPVAYLADGEDLIIVASRGGSPKSPAWFHNLVANPETDVQVGREHRHVRARPLEGEERAEAWRKVVAMEPAFVEYEARTDREIPVIRLSRL